MSLALARTSLVRVYRVLVCGLTLAPLAGCHPGSSARLEPSPAAQGTLSERRFPGVDVIRTPSGGVRIRVLSGLATDGEPLYVIDGTPVTLPRGGALEGLTPEQIARIEVLKYPAETAVYGPRGVNGVVLITTKRSR